MNKVYCNNCDKDIYVIDNKCPYCGLKFEDAIVNKTEKLDFQNSKLGKIIRTIGISITVISIILIIILEVTSPSNDKSTTSTTPKKYEVCEAKTNTYYKCHWSSWEDRCICKQR